MKLLMGLFSFLLASASHAFSYTKEFTEAELQSRLEMVMPLERKALLATVRVSDPRINLHEQENRIAMQATLQALVPGGFEGNGQVLFSGTIFYEPSEGAFYIRDLRIDSLSIRGVPEPTVLATKPVAERLIASALETRPVFVLQDQDMQQRLVRATLQSVEVKNERLRVKLKAF